MMHYELHHSRDWHWVVVKLATVGGASCSLRNYVARAPREECEEYCSQVVDWIVLHKRLNPSPRIYIGKIKLMAIESTLSSI